MRRRAVTTIAVLLLGLGIQDCRDTPSASGQSGTPATATTPVSAAAVLGVDALMKQTTPPKGTIRVEGIVASVDRSASLVGLIDAGEYESCGVTSCAALTLPVRWSGPLPNIKDRVRVEGEIKAANGKLIFLAHHLERVSPIAKIREKVR